MFWMDGLNILMIQFPDASFIERIFVAPSWRPIVHEALEGECVLFSFSDRPVQERIGIRREDHGNV